MGLIKEVNKALEQQINEEKEHMEIMVENVSTVIEAEYYSDLFEDVEQFLKQVAGMIKDGKKLTPDQAKIIGAKLASLELLADPGTSGAALSVVKGSDPTKKLSTIIKQIGNVDTPLGQVDKVLIALANRVGKSGAERNAQMLVGLEGMPEKNRSAKVNELVNLAGKFKNVETKIQPKSVPAPEPAGA